MFLFNKDGRMWKRSNKTIQINKNLMSSSSNVNLSLYYGLSAKFLADDFGKFFMRKIISD